MELLDVNGNRKYTQEMLFNAYKNILIEDGYGEYEFLDDNDWFFVKTGSSVENIDGVMNDIFADIYLIDSFVHNSSDEFGMCGFDFSESYLREVAPILYQKIVASTNGKTIISIGYVGLHVNTQFDVRIYQDNGKWYCIGSGGMHYTKPVCINDFPIGYSREGFKKEYLRENRYHYCVVYN